MGSIEPSAEQFQAFVERLPADEPVVMINLLRYRERANYPEGFDATPCSGREAYERYGAAAQRCIADVGGRVVWAGSVHLSLIAPDGEEWDDALLVEYPRKSAFVAMISSPAYQAVAPHRTAALEDSRLIATATRVGPA